jgi:hypothetical protein
MSDAAIELLVKGGGFGALAVMFAVMIWRAWEKDRQSAREDRQEHDAKVTKELALQTDMLKRVVEFVVRIDNRVYRFTGSGRAKTPTPFWRGPGELDDEEPKK